MKEPNPDYRFNSPDNPKGLEEVPLHLTAETREEQILRLSRDGRDTKGRLVTGKQLAAPWQAKNRKKATSISRSMRDMVELTENDLHAIAISTKSVVADRMAALRLISALNDDERGDKNFDRILDRIEGKPIQTTKIEVEAVKTPDQLIAEIQNDSDYLKGEVEEAEFDEQDPTDTEASGFLEDSSGSSDGQAVVGGGSEDPRGSSD